MDTTAVKAYLPKPLKRRAFAAFALIDMNFSRWAREQLEVWLREGAGAEALGLGGVGIPPGAPTHDRRHG